MDAHPPATRKYLTYRLQNIPSRNISEYEIKRLFLAGDADYIKIKSLAPAIDSPEGEDGDYVATIYFYPSDVTRELAIGGYSMDTVELDKEFLGFTPLYVPKKGPIAADIIAVTGLAGHAYGSWAHSPERMWLRDYLPKDAPNARILTYGYPSQLQGDTSMSILADHTNTFVRRLTDMREDGGALTDIESMGVSNSRLPVRAIVFLAAPHRGLHIDALRTLVRGAITETLIMELQKGSPTLTDLNHRFAHFAKDIDILTCYETKPTKTVVNVDGKWKREGPSVMMVSSDSAQQFNFRERLASAHADHSEIAKIKKGENGIYPTIKSTIKRALVTNATIVASAEAKPAQKSVRENEIIFNSPEDGKMPPKFVTQDTASFIAAKSMVPSEETEDQAQNENSTISTSMSKTEDSPLPQDIKDSAVNLDFPEENVDDSPKEPVAQSITPTLEINENDTDLVKALKAGNLSAVEDLAQDLKNLVQTDNDGFLPLHIAIRLGFEAGVEILLKNKAPTDPLNDKKDIETPLMEAVRQEHPAIVDLLLYYGANVNAISGSHGEAPLHRAVRCLNPDCVKSLLRMKPDINIRDAYGFTPLHTAASFGAQNIVSILVEAGCDPDMPSKAGITPLMCAAWNGNCEMMEILLKYGAKLNARIHKNGFEDGNVPPFMIEKDQNLENIRILGEGGAFLFAALGNQLETLQLLLRKGENINQQSVYEYTALHIAARFCFVDVCQELLDNKANLNTQSFWSGTPLYLAVEYNHIEVMIKLIKAGSKLDFCAYSYGTALHIAAEKGNIEAAKLLIEAGADLEAKYRSNRPLFCAAVDGNLAMVKFLLERGAKAGSWHTGAILSWKNLKFADESGISSKEIDSACKKQIISLLREHEKKKKKKK